MMTNKLEIVKLFGESVTRVEPASLERDWMEISHDKFAYRCLPLNIANQHGWAVYPNDDVIVKWNGGISIQDIQFLSHGKVAASVFGYGILTFHLDFLVRTPPEYNLFITGAPNHFVRGIQPLTGIFESNWAPYSFTMNWKIDKGYANKNIIFTPEDPICFFFPIQKDYIEDFELTESKFEDQEKEYQDEYNLFYESRRSFIDKGEGGWQKNYFQGKFPSGGKCPYANHKTKIRLK